MGVTNSMTEPSQRNIKQSCPILFHSKTVGRYAETCYRLAWETSHLSVYDTPSEEPEASYSQVISDKELVFMALTQGIEPPG